MYDYRIGRFFSSMPQNNEVELKVNAGRYKKILRLTLLTDKIIVKFKFNRALIEEVKNMSGARWVPDKKHWTIDRSQHNEFQIMYLMGLNPYEIYDTEPPLIETDRPLREHQLRMTGLYVTRPGLIAAYEMGLGKSLAWITGTEYLGIEDAWYVGPVSGVKAVGRELDKWNASFQPKMMTYNKLVTVIKNWVDGTPPPRAVCFDESSKLKNRNSQRSQAAKHLADSMRAYWGNDCRILLMTGTPAPKSPLNWFWQCQIAQPGFVREGKENKFRDRLCLMEQRESVTGGVYPHIVTWWDSDDLCKKCGKHKNDPCHNMYADEFCKYEQAKNEVAYLYDRMKGLVDVKFKKDCTDLPEKQYDLIQIKPSIELLRAAKLIKTRTSRTITALTLLRELSDGFQYTEKVVGERECPNCFGQKQIKRMVPIEEIDETKPIDHEYEEKVIDCPACKAKGVVPKYERSTDTITSPKDDILIDDLGEHEEVGRYVVFGGFTGTIDRLTDVIHQQGWATLKIDGRGYVATTATGEPVNSDIFLNAMDRSHPDFESLLVEYPRICVIAHPQAAGMALTFTGSPTILYYSNSFDGEARMQSEDRIHRLGMDENRGAMIKDIILLPTDKLVLDNLRMKKKLQNLTMGQLDDAFTNG